MGSDAHVLVVGGEAADLAYARERIAQLEARWSRFLPDSEISRLNAAGSLRVSAETAALLALAIEASDATGGLFDPTVLSSLIGAGYDRSFELIDPEAQGGTRAYLVPGAAALAIDGDRATLRDGALFDPGGIGKGYAADLVCEGLLCRPGVRGACVNIGGDLRVGGEGPDGRCWLVEIDDPLGRAPLGVVAIEDGAMATTSRMRRRWRRAGMEQHHVIDPRTGAPVRGSLAAVTVIAGEAWWAEAAAKAVFVAGHAFAGAIARDAGVEAIVVADDGTTIDLTEGAMSR